MEFTNNIILSLLSTFRGRPFIQSGEKKVYRWVSLLPEPSEKLESDMLYVCLLSEAMTRNRDSADCHFVCICDRYISEDERDDRELMRNLILVEENRGVAWLLNLIQNRFLELANWEREMNEILLRDGNYQDLMDVSEEYLKNSLFVLDGAYQLIAYSKKYKSTDPINISLYEKGYHTSQVMQRFYEYNRLEKYFESDSIVAGKPGQVTQFETLCKCCWYDGTPLIQVVEVFCFSPVSAESVELFDLMMRYINICFLKEQMRMQNPGQPYGRFMRDMLYHGLSDEDKVAEYAKRTNIPFLGNFDAYRIIFKDNNKVLIGRFTQELSTLLSGAKIISKDFEVSVLNVYSSMYVATLSECNVRQIIPLLEKHGAMLGISAPFTKLTDFSHACTQASIALQYASCEFRYTPQPEGMSVDVYYYGDVMIYFMLHTSTKGEFDFFHNNPYQQKLKLLMEYDRQHDCDLAEILYWFLYYERRATETGKKLHMHRNTVTYHIQHILDIMGVELDNYMTRLLLMLSYHYLESKK